jgi:hypothetical protein
VWRTAAIAISASIDLIGQQGFDVIEEACVVAFLHD